MTTRLEFCRRTMEDATCRRHVSLSSCTGFGYFSAISNEFSSQLHHFWTQRSKTNPSIPIIPSESHIFQRGSTVNPWLSNHFLAKQRWVLRYGSLIIDQHFTSFNLVYVYCLGLVSFAESCIFRDKLWKLSV